MITSGAFTHLYEYSAIMYLQLVCLFRQVTWHLFIPSVYGSMQVFFTARTWRNVLSRRREWRSNHEQQQKQLQNIINLQLLL